MPNQPLLFPRTCFFIQISYNIVIIIGKEQYDSATIRCAVDVLVNAISAIVCSFC